METNIKNEEKIKIYITIEPLGLKIGWVFKKNEKIQSIINFVYIQTKKLGIKYKLGRVNENKTGALLLAESALGDFLKNDDQITVYSEEYGFISNNLNGDNDNNSAKKIFYHKNVSDLYKSLTFLKKKRNGKFKKQNKDIKEDVYEKTEEEDIEEEDKEERGEKEEEKGKEKKESPNNINNNNNNKKQIVVKDEENNFINKNKKNRSKSNKINDKKENELKKIDKNKNVKQSKFEKKDKNDKVSDKNENINKNNKDDKSNENKEKEKEKEEEIKNNNKNSNKQEKRKLSDESSSD